MLKRWLQLLFATFLLVFAVGTVWLIGAGYDPPRYFFGFIFTSPITLGIWMFFGGSLSSVIHGLFGREPQSLNHPQLGWLPGDRLSRFLIGPAPTAFGALPLFIGFAILKGTSGIGGWIAAIFFFLLGWFFLFGGVIMTFGPSRWLISVYYFPFAAVILATWLGSQLAELAFIAMDVVDMTQAEGWIDFAVSALSMVLGFIVAVRRYRARVRRQDEASKVK